MYISSQKFIEPKYFDNAKGLVKKGIDNSIKLNAYFKRKLTELDDIIIDLYNEGKEVTFERIKQRFKNDYSKDFIVFAFEQLNNLKGLIADKTYTGYRQCLINLKNYQGEIPFNQVTVDFLNRYKYYQAVVKKRKANGYYQDFATIRKFCTIAVSMGELKRSPFENFTIDKEDTSRAWHPKEELLKLYSLLRQEELTEIQKVSVLELLEDANVTEDERRHLRYFIKSGKISEAVKANLRHYLYSCFSGLRFGDKQLFNDNNIVNDRMQLRQSKTGKVVTIPFNDQARELLPFVLADPLKKGNNRVNTELQVCMYLAGIKKNITYHCSRHTFAINCLLAGIDIITVRDWLGHKSVKTTEIYAKIADEFKNENMKKLNSYFIVA